MRAEVMEFYGLTRSPRAVGYYDTAHHRQLLVNRPEFPGGSNS